MNKLQKLSIILLEAVLLAACGPISPAATKPAGPSLDAPVVTGAPTRNVEIVVEPVTSSGTTSQSVITGTVTYRNRSALPPTAVIDVTLQDVSLADAPAKVISTQKIEAGGKQPLFAYELKYDPAQIDPAHTYSVSARITDGNQLLFISDTAYPVLTRGAPMTGVDILVVAMSQ